MSALIWWIAMVEWGVPHNEIVIVGVNGIIVVDLFTGKIFHEVKRRLHIVAEIG